MYEVVKISSVAKVNPRIPAYVRQDRSTNVSFVTMADVSENGNIENSCIRNLEEVIKGFTYFERGDVIVAKITPCFENGKAAFVDNVRTRLCFGSTEFHVLRPNGNILGKYLFMMVWNDMFRFYGSKKMTGAAGQKRVSVDFLKNYQIPLPSISEQETLVAEFDNIMKIKKTCFDTISLSNELYARKIADVWQSAQEVE